MAEEAIGGLGALLLESYKLVVSSLPPFFQSFINLFLIVILIFVYSVFIWKFHKFIAHKNIFGLNLNQYNRAEDPLTNKLMNGFFYFVEYIIILPFVIFFWFIAFIFFLILLNKSLEVNTIIIISAAVISAIRMSSYVPHYGETLSKELAKLLPLNLLALSLIEKDFFNVERIFGQISQVPGLFDNITIYLLFIIILEAILRFFDFTLSLFGMEEE